MAFLDKGALPLRNKAVRQKCSKAVAHVGDCVEDSSDHFLFRIVMTYAQRLMLGCHSMLQRANSTQTWKKLNVYWCDWQIQKRTKHF